jgi:hypothetical protein
MSKVDYFAVPHQTVIATTLSHWSFSVREAYIRYC